jgi:ribose-phosphate pyrophosphokinase
VSSLARYTDLRIGEVIIKTFPDGETYHRIGTKIMHEKVILVGGTIHEYDTIELIDLAQGIIEQGARELFIFIPYFGYATMERKVSDGEIVKAKTRAQLFHALPTSHCKISLYLFDLHSEGLPYYFPQNIFTTHIYCKSLLLKVIPQMVEGSFVLGATDAGRAKWVESLAHEIGCEAAFLYKRRISDDQVSLTGANANVEGKKVIIYDDMVRTGSSLLQAAHTYHELGASEIHVMTTHGLFNQDCINRIRKQNIIQKIWCTNSHPNALKYADDIIISDIAELIFHEVNSTKQ